MDEFVVLQDLGLVLIAAAVVVFAALPLKVPPILSYMVAGLLLGPVTGLLGASESLDLFAELGVALLLFVVGLELSVAKIRDVGRTAVLAGGLQVVGTWLGGFLVGLAFGFEPVIAGFLGLAATFSSTVVVVKLLDRAGDLDALYGRVTIGVLLVQDIVVAVVLTVVNGLATGTDAEAGAAAWVGVAGAFAGIALLALLAAAAVRLVARPVFRWLEGSPDAVFIASLAWAFGFILAAEMLHVSVELGSFIAGVALAQLPHNDELRRRVHPLVDFFLAVFFVTLGARMDLAAAGQLWPAALALSAFVLLVKPLLIAVILGPMGLPRASAFRSGLVLGQISEFSFILVGLAVTAAIVPPEVLSLVGLTGLITIGASAVIAPRAPRLFAALDRRGLLRFVKEGALPEPESPSRTGHIVVIGMNTLGRMVVERFAAIGETVLAVDTDVTKLQGLPADTLVGNVDNHAVLEAAGVPDAQLVVSTLQIEDVNSLLAYRCRRMGVPVSVHAFDPSLAYELLEIGADHLMISKYDGIGQMNAAFRDVGVEI